MIKCNHSDILKSILNIFHDTVDLTEIELQSIYQFLFKDHTIDIVLNNEMVCDTIEYLKDIIADHKITDADELAKYFNKKEVDIQVFIGNVMEKLDEEDPIKSPARKTMIIHVGGGLYSIDNPFANNKEILFLLDFYQGVNDRCAEEEHSLIDLIKQAVVRLEQWTERIIIIYTAKVYLFYFREYYFLKFEFADCLQYISPFEYIRSIPGNRENSSSIEWYNLTVKLDLVMQRAFQRMSVMDAYFNFMVNNKRWNLLNKSNIEQPVFQRGKINRKMKISKKPQTPLEEKISAIIQGAIREHQDNQNANEQQKYVGIEESKLSNPLISINR
ncbi:hypothetical protein [Chitinophaga sp. LS1]|uniref:hypothetical protein n=1 Tax=Chitinophaga sp. LS1 TaxID=3051176 RepID=UPI002AAADE3E|nr:hypothetical protein [Chitinophaga sp. LS1]WPV67776.1 hypothetical protein QQL36_03420 [Chitinophaga sp. LS1]